MTTELVIDIVIVAACLAAGGVLKGATGAGAPIIAVPALAALFDVRFAVVVMLAPNLLTNLWQVIRYRACLPQKRFMIPLVAGGMVGVTLGTLALKNLSSDTLLLGMGLVVFAYVALRLARPHWRLEMRIARLFAFPAGFCAGALQGAAGLSAPVSITFLNAMQLGRERFIAAISSLFVGFTSVQIVAMFANRLVHPPEVLYSLFALIPVSLAMPLGAAIARRVSAAALDRLILAILAAIATKLVLEALA